MTRARSPSPIIAIESTMIEDAERGGADGDDSEDTDVESTDPKVERIVAEEIGEERSPALAIDAFETEHACLSIANECGGAFRRRSISRPDGSYLAPGAGAGAIDEAVVDCGKIQLYFGELNTMKWMRSAMTRPVAQ